MRFSRGVAEKVETTGRTPLWRTQPLLDASEQAQLQSWLPIEIRQLSAGPYAGRYTTLDVGDLRLVNERQGQTVHKCGVMAENRCTVSFLRTPDTNARFSHYNETLAPQVFFLPANTEFDVQVPAGVETSYLDFDQNAFLEALRTLELAEWERTPDALKIFDTPGYRHLLHTLEVLEREVPRRLEAGLALDADYARRLLIDSAVAAIGSASVLDYGSGVSSRARRRALSLLVLAREYIDTALARGWCPTVVDVCRHTQVSQRTLQYTFRELLGITPVAYLRIVRLNRARAELHAPSSPATTVTEVAMRWGFLHFGNFSRDFRDMFGELPSETLRRSLA